MRHISVFTLTSVALAASIFAQDVPPAGAIVVSPADDTIRIQNAINNTVSTVFFKAGVYRLNGPLRLRSGVTYIGEGSFHVSQPYGSVLMQTAASYDGLGMPIFTVEGTISSVTITGFTFYRAPGIAARGIAAVGTNSVLVNSTIRENSFLSELDDCIDTPMVSTRIERNEFGKNGVDTSPRHRHIHSVQPGLLPDTNDNWIVGNVFRSAKRSESIFMESGVKLYVTGNDFEENDVDTTLRLRGTSQVIVEGNWFESNRGEALLTLANMNTYSVQIENNFYVMQGLPGTLNVCNGRSVQGNCYIFKSDAVQNAAGPMHVSLGYEMGRAFDASMDLTNSASLGLLTITGPLCFNRNYKGTQAGTHVIDCPQTGGVPY